MIKTYRLYMEIIERTMTNNTSNKEINKFALKWLEIFENEKTNYLELVDGPMGDECHRLGFVMDCGESFSEKYGQASNDFAELEIIIDTVNDVNLLGNAVFSQWRYFNHWAYSGAEILEPKNRKWFVIALTRLAELTEQS